MDNFIEHSVLMAYFEDDSIENIYAEHQAVIDAISAHDPQAAASAMRTHLGKIKVSQM